MNVVGSHRPESVATDAIRTRTHYATSPNHPHPTPIHTHVRQNIYNATHTVTPTLPFRWTHIHTVHIAFLWGRARAMRKYIRRARKSCAHARKFRVLRASSNQKIIPEQLQMCVCTYTAHSNSSSHDGEHAFTPTPRDSSITYNMPQCVHTCIQENMMYYTRRVSFCCSLCLVCIYACILFVSVVIEVVV